MGQTSEMFCLNSFFVSQLYIQEKLALTQVIAAFLS